MQPLQKKAVLISMTMLLGVFLVVGGCTTSKKPMPTPGTPSTPRVTTPSPTYPTQIANRVATEAKNVKGVRQATALISGKIIYVGLDLESNLNKKGSIEVEKMVLERVKKLEPSYTVSVSSDIDTVTRIKKVAQGIAQGKPISSFKNEIENIGKRITPKTK